MIISEALPAPLSQVPQDNVMDSDGTLPMQWVALQLRNPMSRAQDFLSNEQTNQCLFPGKQVVQR